MVVLTRNEAQRLPRMFASLPPQVATYVLDAESSDATATLARARGARVDVRPWAGFVAARRYALAEVRTPWALVVDADEALDDALRAELAALEPPADVDAYALRRTTFFCGRPMRGCGWGDERVVRLVRPERTRVAAYPSAGGTADVHERLEVPGRVAEVAGTLLHDSYPSVTSYREKFARYTAIEARGIAPTPLGFATTLARALARAPWLFFARGGWRDGWRGAYVAVASAAYPVVAYWKAWR